VLQHYLGYGMVIGGVGAIAGVGLGFAVSIFITVVYASFLHVPFISIGANSGVVAIGFVAGLFASLIAAAVPAWAAASIRPAEAMRPPRPPTGRRTILETLLPPLARLPTPIKLALRNVYRVPRRTLFTAFGMAAGVALILVAASLLDSYNSAVNMQFKRIQNYDARVNFTSAFPISVVDDAAALNGVAAAEGIAEVPVELSSGRRSHVTLLQGLPGNGDLLRMYSAGGRRLGLGEGILITGPLADLLGVSKGSLLTVRPLSIGAPARELRVDDIAQQPLGDVTFARLDTAQAILGGGDVGTALLLSFRDGLTPTLQSELYGLPGAANVELTSDLQRYVNQLNDLFLVFVAVMLGFGVALGFAIIFNTITINVVERQRELATMRTFGTGIGRLASMLTVENVLMGLLGVALGMPIGYGLAQYFSSLYRNDLFDMPMVIYTRTYGIAGVGATLVLLLAEVPAFRFVRRLDLPAVVREMSA
jgi:putative ABC transport system permease protein